MESNEIGLGDEVEDSEGEDWATEIEETGIDDNADLSTTDLMLAREPSSREAAFFNMQVILGGLHFLCKFAKICSRGKIPTICIQNCCQGKKK